MGGVECLASGGPALGSVGCMVGLMVTSKRSYSREQLPGLLLSVPLSLSWAPDPASTGDPPTLAGGFGSVSGGLTSFLWVLVCARFCLCPPRLESVFPPVLWKSCNQIPLAFKVRFPGDRQSLYQIPRLGSLTWGSEPSQQWENFFGGILQFVSHPPGGGGIWFYCDCALPVILLWFLLCLWTGVSFYSGFQHPSLDGCSAASCNFGAPAGGDECMSFYSAILNQSIINFLVRQKLVSVLKYR